MNTRNGCIHMFFLLGFATFSEALASSSACVTNGVKNIGAGHCVKGDIFLKGNFIELGVNNVASYGTKELAPSNFAYAVKQLGFIADYEKNGFTGSPGYSGDYFVPGIPLEGWILQWNSSSGSVTRHVNQGLMNRNNNKPKTFSITSTESMQSCLWIGQVGDIEASVSTRFNNDDLFFTTTVTLQNIGSDILRDLYYLRTVDPDQAQVYYKDYKTLNYVRYQPRAADGSDVGLPRNYVHPTAPNTALACAVASQNYNFFLGLGSIHPNVRASHFNFDVVDPVSTWSDGKGNCLWKSFGGNDVEATAAYKSRMRLRDEAIHLTFKFNSIQPGETVQFSFAYVLNSNQLVDAISAITALTIVQPTLEISGSHVDYSVLSSDKTFVLVEYFIFSTTPSVATPAWYKVGESPFLGLHTRHTIFFNSFNFVDGDVELRVTATTASGSKLVASKAARILNIGTTMDFNEKTPGYSSDTNCTSFEFTTFPATVLSLSKVAATDPDPVRVRFFREVFCAECPDVISTFIGSADAPPYQVTVSVNDLASHQQVVVKAIVDNGDDLTQATLCGRVKFVNRAPSAIFLSNMVIPENDVLGFVLGALSSEDPDFGQASTHTFELVDSGGFFALDGRNIVVIEYINYEDVIADGGTVTIRVRVSDGSEENCCLERDFVIAITDVNEAPVLDSFTYSLVESSDVGSTILRVPVTDPDPGDSHLFSFATPSPFFDIDALTGDIFLKSSLWGKVGPFNLTVSVIDSGSPALSDQAVVTIRLLKPANAAPTGADLVVLGGGGSCVGGVSQNTPLGTVIGTVSAVDSDVGDTHTYALVGCEGGVFGINSVSGEVSVVGSLAYVATGDSEVKFQVRVTDGQGASVLQDLSVHICANPVNPTVSTDTLWCYVDEDREVGDSVMSVQPGSPSFVCKILASSEDGSALTYQITSNSSKSGNYKDAFWVEDCSGVLFVVGPIDYEDFKEYTITIGVTGSGGGYSEVNLIIFVVNVNEPPVLTPGGATYSIVENSPKDVTVIPSLLSDVTDPDAPSTFTFSIVSGNNGGVFYFCDVATGKLCTTTIATNFESTSSYYLTIRVMDQGGLFTSAAYTVIVTDVNEQPACVQTSGVYAALTSVPPVHTQLGPILALTDEDNDQTLSVAISGGNADNLFELISGMYMGRPAHYIVTSAVCCPATMGPVFYNLELTVTDSGSPMLSRVCYYGINISVLLPRPPNPTLPAAINMAITENSAYNTPVGVPLLSIYGDGSVTSPVMFSITSYGGDDVHVFRVEKSTGQLYLDKSFLSYELTPQFTYTVTVTGSNIYGAVITSSSVVTIDITDVLEAPAFEECIEGSLVEGSTGKMQNVTSGGELVIYEALDDDSSMLWFDVVSIDGDTGLASSGMFKVVPLDGTSVYLQSAYNFNYEVQSLYNLVLSVTDGTSFDNLTCSVAIENVNDAPVAKNSSLTCFVSFAAVSGYVMCDVRFVDADSDGWGRLNFTTPQVIPGVNVLPDGSNGVKVVLAASVAVNGWRDGQTVSGLTVRATDGGGLFAESVVSIAVLSEFDPPKCPALHTAFVVAEGTVGGVIIGALAGINSNLQMTDAHPIACEMMSGNESGQFSMGSDCILRTGSVPFDFENKSSFELLIKGTEVGSLSPLSSWCTFWVNVSNVEEGCVMETNPVFHVDENIPAGRLTVCGTVIAPLSVRDLEQDTLTGVFVIACMDDTCGVEDIFTIDASSGHLVLKSYQTVNFERKKEYKYTATYIYREGTLQISTPITIVVNDMNEAPTIVRRDLTVKEAPAAVSVGFIAAYDPDYEDKVDFSVSSCGSSCGLKYDLVCTDGPFSLDQTTGELRVTSVGIDFESKTFYQVSVKATDEHGVSGMATFTVHVQDINDCVITAVTDSNSVPITKVTFETIGGQVIFINGRNFGPLPIALAELGMQPSDITIVGQLQSDPIESLASSIFPMSCTLNQTALQYNTRLRCVLPDAAGKDLGIVVKIYYKGVEVAVSPFFYAGVSYKPPHIDSIVSNGQSVVITGSNLGSNCTSLLVIGTYSNSYFSHDVTCVVENDHTQVRCTATDCFGTAITWSLTVGRQTSNALTNVATCGSPVIANITGPNVRNLATCGGDTFYVSGTSFGDVIDNIHVSYGTTGVEYVTHCVVETPGVLLRCTSAPGVGRNLVLRVKVADLESVVYHNAISYARPVISSVYGPGAFSPTTGGDFVYLSGSQFGPLASNPWEVSVTYGATGVEFTALNCRVTNANTAVACTMAPGTGTNLKWVVTIASQPSIVFASSASYIPPSISYYTMSNGAASGTNIALIYGQNFGKNYDSVDLVSYVGFAGAVFNVTGMCAMFTPHKAIQCNIPTGSDVTAGVKWMVIIDGQKATEPPAVFTAPPSIGGMTGLSGLHNFSVYGGDVVNITGDHFGPAFARDSNGKTFLEWVTYGPSGTEYTATNCAVVAPSRISCRTAPGVGRDLVWRVCIAGQVSPPSTVNTSYSASRIVSISPATASTDGSTQITLQGTNFATNSNSPIVQFGDVVLVSTVVSKDVLTFLVPAVTNLTHSSFPVVVSVGGQSSNAIYISYNDPYIHSVNVYESTNGALSVTIIGTSFTLKPIVRIALDGSIIVPSCSLRTHTEISCQLTVKKGTITVSTPVATSNSKYFQFGEPLLLHSSLVSGLPLTSGYNEFTNPAVLYLVGQNMGSETSSFSVYVENQQTFQQAPCEVLSFRYISKVFDCGSWDEMAGWLSGVDSTMDFQEVTCKLPPGHGAGNSIKINRGGSVSLGCGCVACSAAACFNYPAPFIDKVLSPCGQRECANDACNATDAVESGEGYESVWWSDDADDDHTDDDAFFDDDLTSTGATTESLDRVLRQRERSLISDENVALVDNRDRCNAVAACGSTKGLFTLVLVGSNFGSSPKVFVGGSEWPISNSNFTHIVLTGIEREGTYLPITVQAGNQNNSLAFYSDEPNMCYFSYFPPTVNTGISSSVIGTSGSLTPITITGSNFGTAIPVVKLGSNLLRVVSFTESTVSVIIPPGQGKGYVLSVTAGGQTSQSPDTFSYVAPHISDVTCIGSENGTCTAGTEGGREHNVTVHITGTNFGFFNLSWQLHVGPYRVNATDIISWTSTKIVFYPPPGCGKNLRFNLVVGRQQSTETMHYHFSYGPPAMLGAIVPSVLSTDGGTIITLIGENFGACKIRIYVYDRGFKNNPPEPSALPTLTPTAHPTLVPTNSPTFLPTTRPTTKPTTAPTAAPTTAYPTRSPTVNPTTSPTPSPTRQPTTAPTLAPITTPNPTTVSKTAGPTTTPSRRPTPSPTKSPTTTPTTNPTAPPSPIPYFKRPTPNPTPRPTPSKRDVPTMKPTYSKYGATKGDKGDSKWESSGGSGRKEDYYPTDDDRYIKSDKVSFKSDGRHRKLEEDAALHNEAALVTIEEEEEWTAGQVKEEDGIDMASLFHLSDEDFSRSKQDIFVKNLAVQHMERFDRKLADGYKVMEPVEAVVLSNNHTTIEFAIPSGAGSNLILLLAVANQKTAVPFAYSPPVVTRYFLSRGGTAGGNEILRVFGYNFGVLDSPLHVYINETECKNPERKIDEAGVTYIECITAPTTVGPKTVRVEVGFQLVTSDVPYRVECKKRSYGGDGEMCSVCGIGYVCETDGLVYPISDYGFFMTDMSIPSDMCSPESQVVRETCPAALPCIPEESCLGNNQCSREYTGERCAKCKDQFYRINGRCVQCPEAPWAIFLAAVLVVAFGMYVAYKLNQKNVSIGILSIGVDYMQVLGIFGTAKVNWPDVIIEMYNIFSIFNFNIDVFAPVCWGMSSFSFKDKWIIISVLPLATLAVGIPVLIVYTYFFNERSRHAISSTGQHFVSPKHQFLSAYIMLFYYCYVLLANNTFAVFNCQPTDPSDGHKYMAEIGADGGECYSQGTLQQQLEPWAILCFIFYVIGFPTFVGYVLFTNKQKIMTAQVMLAANSRQLYKNEKVSTFRFRMMFNRLYYQFKPDYFYWVFCILCRKFALTVSAVVFRENIVFLLALYVLILFAAYTAQVGYRPYMSMAEYPDVVVENAYLLNETCQDIIVASSQKVQLKKSARRKRLGGSTPLFTVLTPHMSFFNDYNTVEATLIFSAILICISGIMFESEQLDIYQANILAGVVIFIVSLSLMYFFWILFSELWVAFYPNTPLLCIRPEEEKILNNREGPDGDDFATSEVFEHKNQFSKGGARDSTVITFDKPNPLMTGYGGVNTGEEDEDPEDEFRESSGWELTAAHEKIDQLMRENESLKTKAAPRPSRFVSALGFGGTQKAKKPKKPILKKGFSSLEDHNEEYGDDMDGGDMHHQIGMADDQAHL